MTVLLAPRSRPLFDELPPGGEPTLEDVILGAWEGLAAHGSVDCPACGEAMRPVYRNRPVPLGGRCEGCGTCLA